MRSSSGMGLLGSNNFSDSKTCQKVWYSLAYIVGLLWKLHETFHCNAFLPWWGMKRPAPNFEGPSAKSVGAEKRFSSTRFCIFITNILIGTSSIGKRRCKVRHFWATSHQISHREPKLGSGTAKLISHKIQDGSGRHTEIYNFGHNWAIIAYICTTSNM